MASRKEEKPSLLSAIANTIRKVPAAGSAPTERLPRPPDTHATPGYVARVLRQVGGLPWQRILGSGGRISLRGEAALEQRFLLEAEGVRFRGRRVDLAMFEHQFAA